MLLEPSTASSFGLAVLFSMVRYVYRLRNYHLVAAQVQGNPVVGQQVITNYCPVLGSHQLSHH